VAQAVDGAVTTAAFERESNGQGGLLACDRSAGSEHSAPAGAAMFSLAASSTCGSNINTDGSCTLKPTLGFNGDGWWHACFDRWELRGVRRRETTGELNDEAVGAREGGICGTVATGASELDSKAAAKRLNDGSISDGDWLEEAKADVIESRSDRKLSLEELLLWGDFRCLIMRYVLRMAFCSGQTPPAVEADVLLLVSIFSKGPLRRGWQIFSRKS
jgi:hypothetical protein